MSDCERRLASDCDRDCDERDCARDCTRDGSADSPLRGRRCRSTVGNFADQLRGRSLGGSGRRFVSVRRRSIPAVHAQLPPERSVVLQPQARARQAFEERVPSRGRNRATAPSSLTRAPWVVQMPAHYFRATDALVRLSSASCSSRRRARNAGLKHRAGGQPSDAEHQNMAKQRLPLGLGDRFWGVGESARSATCESRVA